MGELAISLPFLALTVSRLLMFQAKLQSISSGGNCTSAAAASSRNSSPHSTEALARMIVDDDMKNLVVQASIFF